MNQRLASCELSADMHEYNTQVLGKDHVIKGLKKCDFTPMYDHAMAEREKKKALSKEVIFFV